MNNNPNNYKFCDVGSHSVPKLFRARTSTRESCCLYCLKKEPIQHKKLNNSIPVIKQMDWQTRNRKNYIKVKVAIKPVSDKQKVRLARYRVVRDEYMKKNAVCEAQIANVCTYKATDLHHKKSRIGDLLWDVTYFSALCSNCHIWVHENDAEARELGFLLSRLDKL